MPNIKKLAKKPISKAKMLLKKNQPSMLKLNKHIASQLTLLHNQKALDQLRNLLSPNFLSYISDQSSPLNRDQYLKGIEMAHQAFLDLTFTIEDVMAEGDKVFLRIIARGKHVGEYYGIPPTGKQVAFAAMTIRRIQNGQIIEEWQTNDQLHLLQQIGCKLKVISSNE